MIDAIYRIEPTRWQNVEIGGWGSAIDDSLDSTIFCHSQVTKCKKECKSNREAVQNQEHRLQDQPRADYDIYLGR